jgi:small subunit ribosomal protein S18
MAMRENTTTMVSKRRVPQIESIKVIDPRDYELLRKFTSEQGKILPARLTGATPQQQRAVARAIRRARVMGVLR